MKKSTKLIILLVVMVLAVGGYLLLKLLPGETEVIDVDKSVYVPTVDQDSITGVEYTSLDQEIKISKDGENWSWTGDPDFPLDQTYPQSIVSSLANITASRLVVESTEDEAQYGFDSPKFEFKLTKKDQSVFSIFVGDYNSVSDGYYLKVQDNKAIYLVASTFVETFNHEKLDMMVADELSSVDSTSVKSVTVNSGDKTCVLTTDKSVADFYSEPYTYFYIDGENKAIPAGAVPATNLVSAAAAVDFNSAAFFAPSEDELAKLGTLESKMSVKVVYEEAVENEAEDTSVSVMTEKTKEFEIGKYIDENGTAAYYANLPGSQKIYSVLNSKGTAMFESISADMSSNLVAPVLKDDTAKMSVEYNGSTFDHSFPSDSDDVNSLFEKITTLVCTEKNVKESGKRVMKCTFTLNSEENYTLEIYENGGDGYVCAFDKFSGMKISGESFDAVKALIK